MFVLLFLVVLCWVIIDYCEFVILYDIYFLLIFLLWKYNYFTFACIFYYKSIWWYFIFYVCYYWAILMMAIAMVCL